VPDWLIWLIGSGALAVGEISTVAFILGPVALAALVTAGAAALGLGLVGQLAVFIVASVASLAIVRPIAKRHLHTPSKLRSGTAALVGEPAVVLERVDLEGGLIKLGGEIWSARAYEGAGTFDPGAHVRVVQISGATAIVME
jgi:membrane protein implicated in regulation of membrane protease activity